ncbi:MAG TPA: hypothetical protein VFI33_00280 [Puia sp.]|nr:hypothetical protein [Puia sp.]
MNNRQERLYFFLVVWFTMISCLNAWGQNNGAITPKKDFLELKYPGAPYNHLYPNSSFNKPPVVFATSGEAIVSQNDKTNQSKGFNQSIDAFYIQPPNIYYLQSGFFCKREWEFEKATHIPFRFRLGSLADCNAMEGKN